MFQMSREISSLSQFRKMIQEKWKQPREIKKSLCFLFYSAPLIILQSCRFILNYIFGMEYSVQS